VKKLQNIFEFNNKEDEDSKLFADVKGRVIHNILKDNVKPENLENVVEDYITGEISIAESSTIEIKSGIINDLRLYFSSDAYRELNEYKNYKNEIEIYCEEGKHYLFGIIDKLIIENDKLIVVDYKTDDVEIGQIKYRAENYLPQLKFYAYILDKLYKDNSKFELRLIFIKHPQEIIISEIDKADLEKFGFEINSAIEKIITGDYKQNWQHCNKCHFALEGNTCVKSLMSQNTF
jgi:ATP-dependent helicase/nuclease subunit A